MIIKNYDLKKGFYRSPQKYMQSYCQIAYGKPSKPRCQQPSMYQILSWKQKQDFKEKNVSTIPQQVQRQKCSQFLQEQQCLKRYGSCPANRFPISQSQHLHKIPQNQYYRDHNLTFQNAIQPNYQQFQRSNATTVKHYPKDQNKQFSQEKRISKKQTKKAHQLKKKSIQNFRDNKNKSSHQNLGAKKSPMKKNLIASNNQQKPRYMEPKKSAKQKLLESENFNEEQFQKMKENAIKRFKQTTRDLSNTSFLTYFNKPPFENYGRGNKNAAGVLYGDYMYTHNIFPHAGQNKPRIQQTYVSALSKAKSVGDIKPHPPLSRTLQQNLVSGYLTLSQIYPKKTSFNSIPIKNSTKLQDYPKFNLQNEGDYAHNRYNPYLNSNQNQNFFNMQNQYLKKNEIPKFYSNKDEIQGKQIKYMNKIASCKKIV